MCSIDKNLNVLYLEHNKTIKTHNWGNTNWKHTCIMTNIYQIVKPLLSSSHLNFATKIKQTFFFCWNLTFKLSDQYRSGLIFNCTTTIEIYDNCKFLLFASHPRFCKLIFVKIEQGLKTLKSQLIMLSPCERSALANLTDLLYMLVWYLITNSDHYF